MLKTTIGLLTFFLTLFIGLFAAVVWIRSSQESCGFASPKVEKVSVFHNSTPAVKSEPTDSNKLAPCESRAVLQPSRTRRYRTISGGVLNEWITCGVLPEYPVNAQGEKFLGTVVLDILTDDSGKIVKASVKSGDRSFGQATLTAAYQSRTTPRLLGGEFVNVKGSLIYEFDREEGVSLLKHFPVEKSRDKVIQF